MRIVVELGETLLSDQQFAGGTVYVGRHEQCQVRLADEQVASRHLMVFEDKGRWYADLLHDAYHATLLNGQRCQGRQSLTDGCDIQVGPFHLKCRIETKAENKGAGAGKGLPSQVTARGNAELQATATLALMEMGLPETAIVKQRTDTFSLSKGRMEYVSALALKMLDSADARSLLSMVSDALLVDFQACSVWIGLRSDPEGHLHLSAGKDLVGRSIDAPPAAQKVSFATVECARAVLLPSIENNQARTCVAGPLISPDGSLGMVYLESDPAKTRYNVGDLDTLVYLCNQMAMAIDRLLRREKEQVGRIRSLDQELARKVQARTAPWQLPQWPELQIAVLSEPGTGDCTDFYDVQPLGDKQAMILFGQTPPGSPDVAISIAELSAAFRIGAVHRDVPPVLLRQVNWLVFSTAGEPRRISAGVLAVDPQTGEFLICLAGNVHAYLVGSSGKVVKIKTLNNPLVGESRKAKYEAVQGKLGPEQTLALCTGGLFSVTTPKGDPFDENHLLDLLGDSYGQIPARILGDLADDISAFSGGRKPPCDITLLLLRKGKPAE